MNALLATLLASQMAVGSSRVVVDIHVIPMGRTITYQGEKYRGFTLEEFKTLLALDHELHIARKQLKLVDDLKLSWNNLLGEKDKIIESLKEDVATYKGRSDRLEGKWETCEDEHDAIQLTDWLPWTIAGLGVVAGAVGLGYGLGK